MLNPMRERKLSLSALLLVPLLLLCSNAHGIHPDDLMPQERPEVINTTNTVTSGDGLFTVTYTSSPDPIPLNDMHSWTVKITNKDGIPVSGAHVLAIGDMPEHRHGMVTKPRVKKARKPGTYQVRGMKFHMPGWWIMIFDISHNGKRDAAMFNMVIGEGEAAGCNCHCDHSATPSGE